MVLDIQPRVLLVDRRRRVQRFWSQRGRPDKRSDASQAGVAAALGTSLMAVSRFESEERDDFPNGKGVAEYEAYLEQLEEEVEEERRRGAK